MGSFERKMRRKQLKESYKRFSDSFRTIKAEQQERLKNGMPIDKDQFLLSKKMTFNQYKLRVDELMNTKRAPIQESKEESSSAIDTTWEDQ